MYFDDFKPWLIGLAVLLAGSGVVYAMTTINVNGAIAKCESAGYGTPEKSFSVTSCPADEDFAHDSIAMVVGNVAGSPIPTVTDTVSSYLQNSLAQEKNELDFYIYSATPSGAKLNLENKKLKDSGNVVSFIRNSLKQLESVDKAIQSPPIEDGVDYFNNVMAASRAASTSPKTEKPLVIVMGSGLSDTQPLNFANNDILHAEPKQILESLKKSQDISPNTLSGTKILWSGLGVTVAPQQPLDAKERRNLTAIYRSIFEYMGATFVSDDTVMASDSIDTDKAVKKTKVNGINGGVVVYKLGENSIGFKPETANIIDTDKAEQALSGIVESYKQCKSVDISIEGYQARPDGKILETSKLSQDRADAVKGLLIDKGVSEQSITAIGKGSSDFEGRVSELDKEEVWSTDRAQANRVVIVEVSGGGTCSS